VENIDVGPDQRADVEVRKLFLQIGLGRLKQVDHCIIHVDDIESLSAIMMFAPTVFVARSAKASAFDLRAKIISSPETASVLS
jgi:hypothetical protein